MRQFSLFVKILGVLLLSFMLFFVFGLFKKEYGLKKSSVLIPLLNTPADRNLASVKTYIGKNSYSFVINTDNKLPCVINREDLEEFQNGKEVGVQTWHQLNGKESQSPKYLLERIDVGAVPITNTSYTINTASHFGIGEIGTLGTPILRQYDYWLFDFPKSRLYLIKDKKKFKKCFRLPFKRFIKQSLEPVNPHIIFKVDTQLGERKFSLATALKTSYMRKPSGNFTANQKLILQKPKVNGQELGPLNITLIDFPDIFVPDDGALAMDFLKNRAIFLDFKDNKIFIGPNEASKEDKMKIYFN